MSDQFVRVIDPATGYQRTAHVTEVESNPALKVLVDHAAVSPNGTPLPPKFNVAKGAPPAPADDSTTTIVTGAAGKGDQK